ncbi:hypothetical protein ACFO26_08030 [Lactococcus nasutitermitis]|uniref:Uncharacterized protein n=1 Tax=Lactococcus nasutitermitis TaxID=1652957 RepID=A0ABV9JDQ3_9LACT|nr:hypothetical protein [Lactococcus nasutitermitis]
MKRIENFFCYFSIFYLLNYLWIEKYLPVLGKLQLVNIIVIVWFIASLVNIPYLLSKKLSIMNFIAFSSFLILILIGMLSSFLFSYQGFKAVLIDGFLFSRFMIIFYAFSLLISEKSKKKMKQFFIVNLKSLVVINFILLLINIPLKIFPTLDIRFGFPSQQLIYSHPTYLASISFLGWALISGRNKKYYQLMAIILMLSTMRTKILLLILVYFFYYFLVDKIKIPIIQNMISIIGLGTLGYTSFGDIVYTKLLNTESSVRATLMSKAAEIAKDHFPLGSGFSTFGSYTSFVHYSPLYNLYGLSDTYGFLTSSYQYGMDSYVSMLFAQFGFFGGILYFIMFLAMIINLITDVSVDKKRNIELLALFLLISCFTESTISTGIGIAIFGFLAINDSKTYDEK